MSKLIQSKLYAKMITISDYILLGILWILTSLFIVTLFSATSSTMYVLEKWHSGTSGQILHLFFRGMKRHIILSVILSFITIMYMFTIESCVRMLEMTHRTPIILVVLWLSGLLFYGLLIGLLRHTSERSVTLMFSKAYWDMFNHLLTNIMIILLSYAFYVVVSIFPPIIFLLIGLYLKFTELLLQVKY